MSIGYPQPARWSCGCTPFSRRCARAAASDPQGTATSAHLASVLHAIHYGAAVGHTFQISAPSNLSDLCAALSQACAELGGAEVNSEAAERLKAVAHAAHAHLRNWRPSAEQLEQLLSGRSHAAAVAALATDRLAAAAAGATDDDMERAGVEALATLTLAVSLLVCALSVVGSVSPAALRFGLRPEHHGSLMDVRTSCMCVRGEGSSVYRIWAAAEGVVTAGEGERLSAC